MKKKNDSRPERFQVKEPVFGEAVAKFEAARIGVGGARGPLLAA